MDNSSSLNSNAWPSKSLLGERRPRDHGGISRPHRGGSGPRAGDHNESFSPQVGRSVRGDRWVPGDGDPHRGRIQVRTSPVSWELVLVSWRRKRLVSRFGALLLVFFFTSSKLTNMGEEKKRKIDEDFKQGGQRNWLSFCFFPFRTRPSNVINLEVVVQLNFFYQESSTFMSLN